MEDWQSELLSSFREGLQPPDNDSIDTWATKNVCLGPQYSQPGQFSVARSRYMLEPFASLKNPHIRQVNIMASPRTAKSLVAEIFLGHSISNKSGNMLWLQSSDSQMKTFAELRLLPFLKGCKPVNDLINPKDRFSITKERVIFPHATVTLTAAKIRALTSIGYPTIVGDECWLWPGGHIDQTKTRTVDFQATSKVLFISQAAGPDNNTEWNDEFDKAPVHEWGWQCPKCAGEQVLSWAKKREDGSWSGVTWDENEQTKPGGKWNYEEAARTARLQCHHCRHELTDTPQNRRLLNDTGRYICTKEQGDATKVSYRWNALANMEISFAFLITKFLQAKDESRYGLFTGLENFYLQQLATPPPQQKKDEIRAIILGEYDPTEKFGDRTFLTIDCQKDGVFFYVIRAWKKTSESRLLKYGQANSWDELRKIQAAAGLKDHFVFIDSGNDSFTIYQRCVGYGHPGLRNGKNHWFSWVALKGEDGKEGKELYMAKMINPHKDASYRGRQCPFVIWSNKPVKDILFFLRDGKGAPWLAKEVDEEYTRQLNSEILVTDWNKKTNRPTHRYHLRSPGEQNHYLDCEAQQIVAALMHGCLGNINNTISTQVST